MIVAALSRIPLIRWDICFAGRLFCFRPSAPCSSLLSSAKKRYLRYTVNHRARKGPIRRPGEQPGVPRGGSWNNNQNNARALNSSSVGRCPRLAYASPAGMRASLYCAGAGGLPAARRLATLFSISNQNGAPSETAIMVKAHPASLVTTLCLASQSPAKEGREGSGCHPIGRPAC